MSKLPTALLAAGLALGVNAAAAQDVKSDQSKADRLEKIMQEKEQGASTAGTRNYAAPSDIRSESNQSGNATTKVGGSEQIPSQSLPSVGHPKEGAVSGQFGVKKLDESRQLDQSTSGMSDQSSGNVPDKHITPN
jgi:hypothetical protein